MRGDMHLCKNPVIPGRNGNCFTLPEHADQRMNGAELQGWIALSIAFATPVALRLTMGIFCCVLCLDEDVLDRPNISHQHDHALQSVGSYKCLRSRITSISTVYLSLFQPLAR